MTNIPICFELFEACKTNSEATNEAINEIVVKKDNILKTDISIYSEIFEACKTNYEATDEANNRIQVKRDKVSVVDKERIIEAFENGESVTVISKMLSMKSNTVKNIIYRYNKSGQITTGKIGGYRKVIITEEIGNSLLKFIDENNLATLLEMRNFLLRNYDLNPSASTISNFLRNKSISRKKSYSVVEKNSSSVKDIRYEYVTKFLHDNYRQSQCIYIGETFLNVWMQGQISRYRSNISFLLAISKKGPVHFKVIIGCFTYVSYQEFVTELSIKLLPTTHYLINDNVAIHNSTLVTAPMHHIINLPPFSQFLNPVETLFSVIKSKLKAKATKLTLSANSVSEKRQIIDDLITEVLQEEIFRDLSNNYRHVKTFFPECLIKKDIL